MTLLTLRRNLSREPRFLPKLTFCPSTIPDWYSSRSRACAKIYGVQGYKCSRVKWNCRLGVGASERARGLACRSGSKEGRRDDEDDGKKKWIHSATIGAVAGEMGREEKVGGKWKRRTEGRMEGHGQRRPAHPTELVIHRAIRRWATRFFRGKRNHLSPFSPLPYIFLQDLGTQWTSQGFKLLNQNGCSVLIMWMPNRN